MKDKTPLYHYLASYAQEHGEFEQYQAALQSNIACRKAIEKAISAHYRDYILGDGALQDVLKQFDYERILFVLAVTVQNKDWDGRISRDNKLWAQFNVYGLTEAGPRVSAQRKYCCNGASVGKPIEGVTITIVDNDGNKMANGKKGNVYVKTQCRFTKYVSSKLERISNLEGWINTGDVGFIDNNDELFIVGRSDTCIIHQSHNIYPESVESVLMETNCFTDCKAKEMVCNYYVTIQRQIIKNYWKMSLGKSLNNVKLNWLLMKYQLNLNI